MSKSILAPELMLPDHYNPGIVGEVWKVPYQERAKQARDWARLHNIPNAANDQFKIALLGIDIQNTFCIPGFELFVAGRSGTGAVDDNRRLCEFIYRNLARITQIIVTLDSHLAMQIFHPIFVVDDQGNHPEPLTLISYNDVMNGRWKFNPAIADDLQIDANYGQNYLEHYTRELEQRGKYELTIWPYHVMLGSIGHALVPGFEEAIFFHTFARYSQPNFEVKGDNPLTEHYSAISPEVTEGPAGEVIAHRNYNFYETLTNFDAVVIAGQAKSHCVAWTIEDLLADIRSYNISLAKKVYLLEDCTSPVVIPGVIDYTNEADAAFEHFANSGMNLVRSTEPLESWPGIQEKLDTIAMQKRKR